jgi:glycosyltransferase involved in cell wall biosynthesis
MSLRNARMNGNGTAPAIARNGGTPRRYGLLGFPFSRIPSQDTSYSSLDNVTWSTALALGRRGDEVVVAAWDVQAGDAAGIEIVPVDGRPDWLIRRVATAARQRRPTLPWSSRFHHPYHLASGVRRLRERGAQVIELTHEYANLLPARLLAGRAPVITQLHAVWVDDEPSLARRLRHADAVATVSDFVRRAICDVEPRLESRTATVRNGIDLEAFPGRAAVRAADPDGVRAWRMRLDAVDRPLVVAVGRVTPEKGTHVLAEASAILRDRGRDVVVAVAGQKRARYQRPGPARRPLWREIERLNDGYLERVTAIADGLPFHLLDSVAPTDLLRLLAAADLFVAPSFAPEPCPLPVLEAMAMDLPVVASDDGGYPELVGDAALLVRPGDAGALADAIDAMLTSDVARERYARRARAQAARHTWDATASALADLAERVS